jgi:hypothetical protein
MAGAFQSDSFQGDSFETGAASPTLTLDAVLLRSQTSSLTLDGVLRRSQSASLTLNAFIQYSFTLDAVIQGVPGAPAFQSDAFQTDAFQTSALPGTATLTLDAVLLRTQNASFTANAVLRRSQSSSLTLDATITNTISRSFTLDAALVRTVSTSLTAAAVIKRNQSRSLTLDAYLDLAVIKHDRTTFHSGVDHVVDHVLAQGFDRYAKNEDLMDVLIDLDARITAREKHKVLRSASLRLDAVIV